jgi:hypothetical protein
VLQIFMLQIKLEVQTHNTLYKLWLVKTLVLHNSGVSCSTVSPAYHLLSYTVHEVCQNTLPFYRHEF